MNAAAVVLLALFRAAVPFTAADEPKSPLATKGASSKQAPPSPTASRSRRIRLKSDGSDGLVFLEIMAPLYTVSIEPQKESTTHATFKELKRDGPVSTVRFDMDPPPKDGKAGAIHLWQIMQFRMASVRGAKHFALLAHSSEDPSVMYLAFSFGSIPKTKSLLKKMGWGDDHDFVSLKEAADFIQFEILPD